MAPLSSGVIMITQFRSSGVMGICQVVPVTHQVIPCDLSHNKPVKG